ncbi:hypothetical protein ACGF13_01225 [Kitasatospora sp. NPDC048286]|uniref:hypothetical protein n=1 Tax=unclassified Kitasatospora TaxID=2633591 RepID=UPI0037141137
MTTIIGSTWRRDPAFGAVTRHPMPVVAFPTTTYRILDLPEALLREEIAVHEAGHAVLAFHLGMRFTVVSVADDLGHGQDTHSGRIEVPGVIAAPPYDVMLFAAAGERAADRWLREAGLWTPARAWVVEILAEGDREAIAEYARRVHPDGLTYGVSDDPSRDLAALHDQADALLDTLWDRVTALTAALTQRGRLTEEQAAEAAGFSPKAGWQR